MDLNTKGQFKERIGVKFATFGFLCEKLRQFLQKQDTPFINSNFVETRIAILLIRLGSGNEQLLIGDLYGIVKHTVSKIVREFSKAIKQHFQQIFVQMLSELQFRILTKEVEALHCRCNRWVAYCFICSNGWWRRLLLPKVIPLSYSSSDC